MFLTSENRLACSLLFFLFNFFSPTFPVFFPYARSAGSGPCRGAPRRHLFDLFCCFSSCLCRSSRRRRRSRRPCRASGLVDEFALVAVGFVAQPSLSLPSVAPFDPAPRHDGTSQSHGNPSGSCWCVLCDRRESTSLSETAFSRRN